MSTVVVTGRGAMSKQNEQWGRCIKNLLERHGLSLRGAEIKTGASVTRSYISEWTTGKVPQYETAIQFLMHFPHEEAIECLVAAGFPVPADWQKVTDDPIERVRIALNGVGLEDYQYKRIQELIKKHRKKPDA